MRVRGTVWDLTHFGSTEKAEKAAESEDYEKVFLKARPETVGQAKIFFKNSDAEVVLEAKPSGRFWGYVVPGDYTVSVSHPDYQKLEQPLTVPVRKHPIWPEIPGVETEDEDQFDPELFLTKP